MSTHEAKVIRIEEILPHPDPETVNLGLVKVWDYQVVVNKNQWKVGELAVYVEPDTVVDGARPEFSFLNKDPEKPKQHRIKAKRLRGTWSEGLLTPAPEGFNEGDDAWETLGLIRYEPKMKNDFKHGDAEKGPVRLPFGKYDLENFRKYHRLLQEGERVIISEKIHGANARFLFMNDRMWAGSRSMWKKPGETCLWWKAIDHNIWVADLCAQHPNKIFYGEVFGSVQSLKYGANNGQIFLRLFDAWFIDEKRWMDNALLLEILEEDQMVPVFYDGPYSKEKVLELTDGPSVIPGANHIREGVVIKPAYERIDPRHGRVALKNVSNEYLLRSKG